MGRFEAMKLEWGGIEYKVPPNRVMPAIAVIEEVITLVELYTALSTKKVPLAKISMAYGALLRYAGADVMDEDVYRGMFGKNINQERITTALVTLLALMAPPAHMGTVGEGASPEGNVSPAVVPTSKKHSKRRSGKTNSSARVNSGKSILSTSGP